MKKRSFPVRLRRAFRAAFAELTGKRSTFEGAAIHRLLLDWIVQAKPADEEIRGDLRMLRARARDLARNNSYVKRYFKLLVNNVIGPMGMRLQAQVKVADELAQDVNRRIDTAWKDWADAPVTIDGLMTLRRFEKLLLKTMACDGEAFVRVWRGLDVNSYGIGFQPIDADLVDETYSRARRETTSGIGNEIRMGVEVDAIGRRVGYWVWTQGENTAIRRERYFVPAREMIHLYDPDRVNQTRGVTWIHAAMSAAHMLDAYEQSEAVAARIGASKMGLFEKLPDSIAADMAGDTTPAQMEANPGTFDFVPDGYAFKTWDPEHPTGQFPAFIKQMLRKIASAFSVFYNVLANDAEGVSYSTMRSFSLVERDDWRSIQQDFIDMWRRPVYASWLDAALLTGRMQLPTRDPRDYLAVRHRPRGWQWIDPQKEASAAAISIENGMGTRTGFLAEKGEDIEEVFAELAREQELAGAYGITISGKGNTEAQGQAPGGENGTPIGEDDLDAIVEMLANRGLPTGKAI
jgi:lambda family phage portal protein